MARRKAQQKFLPREQLELFVERCEELSKTRLIVSGAMSSIGFTFKGEAVPEGFKVTYEAREPDTDDLRSFLMTFRKFILKDGPIFIERIFNLCHQHLKDDKLKTELIKARAAWRDEMKGFGGIALQVDGKQLTAEYVLDLWINGNYFHDDLDHVRELERLATTAIRLDRMGFLIALPRLTQIIFNVGMIIAYGLKNGAFDSK